MWKTNQLHCKCDSEPPGNKKTIFYQMATSTSIFFSANFSLLSNTVFTCLAVSWFGKKFLKQKYVRI